MAAAKATVEAGVAVMGHVGLMPQAISVLGGFRPQGQSGQSALRVMQEARVRPPPHSSILRAFFNSSYTLRFCFHSSILRTFFFILLTFFNSSHILRFFIHSSILLSFFDFLTFFDSSYILQLFLHSLIGTPCTFSTFLRMATSLLKFNACLLCGFVLESSCHSFRDPRLLLCSGCTGTQRV